MALSCAIPRTHSCHWVFHADLDALLKYGFIPSPLWEKSKFLLEAELNIDLEYRQDMGVLKHPFITGPHLALSKTP